MKRSACFMLVFDYRNVISIKVITRAQALAAGTSHKMRWFCFPPLENEQNAQ